jgi:hypothetical protein
MRTFGPNCENSTVWSAEQCCFGGFKFATVQQYVDRCSISNLPFCVPEVYTPTPKPTTLAPTKVPVVYGQVPTCSKRYNCDSQFNRVGKYAWACMKTSGPICGESSLWSEGECCSGGRFFDTLGKYIQFCDSAGLPFCAPSVFSPTQRPTVKPTQSPTIQDSDPHGCETRFTKKKKCRKNNEWCKWDKNDNKCVPR